MAVLAAVRYVVGDIGAGSWFEKETERRVVALLVAFLSGTIRLKSSC